MANSLLIGYINVYMIFNMITYTVDTYIPSCYKLASMCDMHPDEICLDLDLFAVSLFLDPLQNRVFCIEIINTYFFSYHYQNLFTNNIFLQT